MAELIQLEQTPSVKFAIPLGGNNYDIRIYMLDYSMAYDIDINNGRANREGNRWLIEGFKFNHEIPMLVYPHQEVNGNLLLVIPDDEEADYTKFGSTQFLVYLSQGEIDQYREAVGV